ncbi:PASTA domain-containing protein [Paenibacillus hemerocallicola]|uniref:PASTA domain-containing protein n=1 Tax=Paenibacillus hemerocallicola TaxID=1172614 RepID=A0A5C4TB40_9BACL|nr:PASTA domain-containing protein [Paenibacillus hemerocallicola]TNJ66283.1 PASTA domain-containing protein [Paenibacillus hemerocallicola]
MKPISNRYELKQLLGPIHDGQLYEGKDLSLQRSVFIYEVQLQGESAVQQYIGRLGSAAQQGATDSPFLHVLDIEVGSGYIHVVISYKPGSSFRQFVRNHPPSFKETTVMISALGQALLDAAEERHLNFSLDPGNIWITEDGTINVINTWDRPEQPNKISKRLSQLFVQLMTRSDYVPADAETFSTNLLRALELPTKKKEEVVAAVTDAWKERITLVSFVQFTQSLLQPKSSVAAREERAAPVQTWSAPPQIEEEPAAYMEEERESRPPSRARWFKIGKKVWLGISFSAVGLAVFAGAFVLLVETMNRDRSKPADPVIVEHRPQTTTPQKTAEETNKQKTVSVPPSESQPIVGVPTLTGLPKEAAEKMALETGLRYTYYLEVNSQPAGTVFKQEPTPNEQVEKGSHVTFWISKGPVQQ